MVKILPDGAGSETIKEKDVMHMILVLIMIGMIVAGIILWKFSYEHEDFGMALIWVGAILSGIMFIVIGAMQMRNDFDYKVMKDKRTALTLQLDKQTYINDNNLGTAELMDQVTEFNGDIYFNRTIRNNPWFNWFAGDWGDRVEPIDLNYYLEEKDVMK